MELQFYGANCLRINTKKATLVVDDNLNELKASSVTKSGDIAVFTGEHKPPAVDAKLVIDYPGEYEVSNVSIHGIATRGHHDEEGQKSTIIYRVVSDDSRLLVIGHIYPELSDEQLEAIGTVDVLCIPVGGNGYTLDGTQALKLIKKIEPKIVIPTHYEDKKLGFPVAQQELTEAIKALAMEPKETLIKFKIKPAEFTDVTQLVVLERS